MNGDEAISWQVEERNPNSLSGKKPKGLNAVEMVISVEPLFDYGFQPPL